MKALSIFQPWASLIAHGKKTIEARSWRTSYRGNLLICSGKVRPIQPAEWAQFIGCRELSRIPQPLGVALAIAQLVGCRSMTIADEDRALCFYGRDLYAWVLEEVRRIEPIPVRGRQRLWNPSIVSERLRYL